MVICVSPFWEESESCTKVSWILQSGNKVVLWELGMGGRMSMAVSRQNGWVVVAICLSTFGSLIFLICPMQQWLKILFVVSSHARQLMLGSSSFWTSYNFFSSGPGGLLSSMNEYIHIIKKSTNNKCWREVEEKEPSYTTGGDVSCCSSYAEQYGRSLRNWK